MTTLFHRSKSHENASSLFLYYIAIRSGNISKKFLSLTSFENSKRQCRQNIDTFGQVNFFFLNTRSTLTFDSKSNFNSYISRLAAYIDFLFQVEGGRGFCAVGAVFSFNYSNFMAQGEQGIC